jgi:hypothetical protein
LHTHITLGSEDWTKIVMGYYGSTSRKRWSWLILVMSKYKKR